MEKSPKLGKTPSCTQDEINTILKKWGSSIVGHMIVPRVKRTFMSMEIVNRESFDEMSVFFKEEKYSNRKLFDIEMFESGHLIRVLFFYNETDKNEIAEMLSGVKNKKKKTSVSHEQLKVKDALIVEVVIIPVEEPIVEEIIMTPAEEPIVEIISEEPAIETVGKEELVIPPSPEKRKRREPKRKQRVSPVKLLLLGNSSPRVVNGIKIRFPRCA